MGLDMYLIKKTHIGANYDHNIGGGISLTKSGKPIKIDMKRLSEITESVGYWRKANHVHKWFVENVQRREDDCGEYWVSQEHLEKLLADCKAVKKNKNKADKILPTTNGFFFGGTDYDESYYADIDYTIEVCTQMIKEYKEDKNGDVGIYYHSSW